MTVCVRTWSETQIVGFPTLRFNFVTLVTVYLSLQEIDLAIDYSFNTVW